MFITQNRLVRSSKAVSYNKTNFQRPSDDASPSEKEKAEWNLAWQNYIYATHQSGGSVVSLGMYDRIDKNRSYSYGTQDIKQYMDRYDPTGVQPSESDTKMSKSKRQGYANINPNIVPVIPKLRDVFVGLMMSVDHDVVLRAIDPLSAMQKEEELEVAFAYKELEPIFKQNGINVEPPDYIPSSKQELEMYLSMGLHKLRYEVALERALGHAFDQSKWTTEMRKEIYEEIFDNNMAIVHDYVDIKNQRVQFKHLDPKDVILPYTKNTDFTRYSYGAYQTEMTVADFRAENPKLTEQEVRQIAVLFSKSMGNESCMLDAADTYLARGKANYDGYVLPVMYACYKTVNKDKHSKRVELTAKKRKITEAELTSGKVIKEGNKYFKYVYTDEVYRTIYHSKWVIGTDYIWEQGVINDVPRYEDDVVIPIHCVSIKGLSLNERCQPNADNMQMAWLKFQNAWNNAAPKGLVVDEISITSTASAAGLKPKDLLRIRRIQGDMILNFNPKNSHTLYDKANGKPFHELEGGIGGVLDEFIKTWTWNLNIIQNTIGLNEAVDASNPNPEVTMGQTEFAAIGTSNALKTRYNSYIVLKETIVKNAIIRIMRLVYDNKDKIKGYYKIIGEPFIESIKIAYKRGLSPSDIGISIKARPTQKELQEIEMMLQKAMMSGKNGIPTITTSDYFMIKNVVTEGGGILTAQTMLAMREAEAEKKAQENAMAIQQQAADEARKTAQIKMQLEEQIAQAEHLRKKELVTLEKDLELRNKQAENEGELKAVTTKANMDLKNSLLTKSMEQQPQPSV